MNCRSLPLERPVLIHVPRLLLSSFCPNILNVFNKSEKNKIKMEKCPYSAVAFSQQKTVANSTMAHFSSIIVQKNKKNLIIHY